MREPWHQKKQIMTQHWRALDPIILLRRRRLYVESWFSYARDRAFPNYCVTSVKSLIELYYMQFY
jgi:hypothetical protein